MWFLTHFINYQKSLGTDTMRIVIPFKKENAKSRLSGVLTPDERDLLAMKML